MEGGTVRKEVVGTELRSSTMSGVVVSLFAPADTGDDSMFDFVESKKNLLTYWPDGRDEIDEKEHPSSTTGQKSKNTTGTRTGGKRRYTKKSAYWTERAERARKGKRDGGAHGESGPSPPDHAGNINDDGDDDENSISTADTASVASGKRRYRKKAAYWAERSKKAGGHSADGHDDDDNSISTTDTASVTSGKRKYRKKSDYWAKLSKIRKVDCADGQNDSRPTDHDDDNSISTTDTASASSGKRRYRKKAAYWAERAKRASGVSSGVDDANGNETDPSIQADDESTSTAPGKATGSGGKRKYRKKAPYWAEKTARAAAGKTPNDEGKRNDFAKMDEDADSMSDSSSSSDGSHIESNTNTDHLLRRRNLLSEEFDLSSEHIRRTDTSSSYRHASYGEPANRPPSHMTPTKGKSPSTPVHSPIISPQASRWTSEEV